MMGPASLYDRSVQVPVTRPAIVLSRYSVTDAGLPRYVVCLPGTMARLIVDTFEEALAKVAAWYAGRGPSSPLDA